MTGRRTGLALDIALQVLVVAGVPVGLWTLTGNPIPRHLPTSLQIRMWWAGVQLHPATALDLLPWIVLDALWIGWAWYTTWWLLGTLWDLLHLPAVLLPRILLRLTPRTTVHALTAGAVAATPIAQTAPAPHHPDANALPADLNGRLHLTATRTPTRAQIARAVAVHGLERHPALKGAPVHTVVEGDNLWDLAVHYYGDGEQWRRIFTGNMLRPQPDGATLHNPDLIQPGWQLIIPHRNPPAAPNPNAPAPATTNPAPAPGRTGAPHAAPDRTGTAPGPGAPHTPAPAGHRATRPAPAPPAHPATPHTVGWHIPTGGYIGITLIAAIASSVALLRTRERIHPGSTPHIPDHAHQLAAVYDAARHATTRGQAPDGYRGPIPPLFKPQVGIPMLGTVRDGQQEDSCIPSLYAGPVAYTGAGAQDVVRAAALAVLGSSDTDQALPAGIDPIGEQVLLIDRDLARELLGARPEQQLPGWLHLTDTPQQAVAQFDAIARRRADAGIEPDEYLPTDEEPVIYLIVPADPALCETIVQACLADRAGSLDALLLGSAPDAADVTTVEVAQDGAVTAVVGPRSGEIRGMTLYSTPRDLAAELFAVLYTAREVYRRPAAASTSARGLAAPGPALLSQTRPEPGEPAALAPVPQTAPPVEPSTAPTADRSPTIGRVTAPVGHETAPAGDGAVLLRVLGPLDVLPHGQQPRAVRGQRITAILLLLALHPAGLSSTRIGELVWDEPVGDEAQQKRNVHSTMYRVREHLRTAVPRQQLEQPFIVVDTTERYRLDPALVTTDLQHRDRLERQADRTDDPDQRLRLLIQAAAVHRGPLADGLDDDARDWLTSARYEQALHAARLHLRIADLTTDTDPATSLDHLNQALDHAPDDQHAIAEASRLYQRLGRPDLARDLQRRHRQ